MSWYKKFLLALVLIGIVGVSVKLILSYQDMRKSFSHYVSSSIGLDRIVIEQDNQRKEVRRWEGRLKIEVTPSGIAFIEENGKEIKVSAPYLVLEK